jgi:hypothetical protein
MIWSLVKIVNINVSTTFALVQDAEFVLGKLLFLFNSFASMKAAQNIVRTNNNIDGICGFISLTSETPSLI